MKKTILIHAALGAILLQSCVNDKNENTPVFDPGPSITLEDMALYLSRTGLGTEQMNEVFDAVSCSSDNGYDQEYLFSDLISDPGAGVGGASTKSSDNYTRPLRELLRESLSSEADAFLAALEKSDLQIYWPYSENWDGKTLPVITFDPMDGSEANMGYRLLEDGRVEEVLVTEEMALNTPVWVVNRNDDSSYTTLEMLRKNDPDWGQGGSIIIGHHPSTRAPRTKSSSCKALLLKDFTAKRNFDTWFAGASEFFCKIGSVEDFNASTEAELKLYSPTITDFMITVRRNEVGQKKEFNAVLVSEWTEQLERCAFLLIEDDGGTWTNWNCSAVVKVQSKSYGFEISIPLHSSDDIVWRGQLSRNYVEAGSGKEASFGDVSLTFCLEDF